MNGKTLYIVRHGKSTWDYTSIEDIDRPLKETGIQKTILLSQKIRGTGIPDLIVSSPAARAIHTALILARELDYPVSKIMLNELIYTGDTGDLDSLIKKSNDLFDSIMIVGHNPIVTNLANLYLQKTMEEMPTSSCVALCFSCVTWNEIEAEKLISEQIITVNG